MHIVSSNRLLSAPFMARLDRLDLLSRRIFSGKLNGDRSSRRHGTAIEFADLREYVAGDDPRFVDWNACARLDRLFIKLFAAEQDLSLDILLDGSRSCGIGEPNKAVYLKQIAAAMGYVALVNGHRLRLWAMADGIVARGAGLRGRVAVAGMLDFLAKQNIGGASDFKKSCRQFAASRRHPGVCVVLSDFFFQDVAGEHNDLQAGLAYLSGAGHDFFCIQILSPQEIDPPADEFKGDMTLLDSEDARAAGVRMTPRTIEGYQANLREYCAAVKEAVARAGGTYLFARTDTPADRFVLESLRQNQLIG